LLLCCCAPSLLAQRRPTQAPAPSVEVQTLYQKAREAEARKEYKEAAAIYETILAKDPTLHPLRANLGMMRFLDGEYAAAARAFEQALKGDPTLYAAKLFLGVSLLELNQLDAALRHLESAVKEKPADQTARFHLARAYFLKDDFQRALAALKSAPADDAESLYLLGRIHGKLSIESFERLKQKHPENYRIYQLLGENYELQGQYGPAIANYRKAIERNPLARGLRLKLGEVYLASGDPDNAAESFREELRANPNDAFASYRLGSL